jgi:hypothetical protein
VKSLHRKFHGVDHSRVTVYDWPDPVGRLKKVGLLKAFTYGIPKGLASPEKSRCLWRHEFGDHGEWGHGPVSGDRGYPQKYMPQLLVDTKGHYYIKRRRGNRYVVTEWIYW